MKGCPSAGQRLTPLPGDYWLPPLISHLCLFPELLPVEPLHLHGGIGFLVSGALGRRRGWGGGGAGISEGR